MKKQIVFPLEENAEEPSACAYSAPSRINSSKFIHANLNEYFNLSVSKNSNNALIFICF